MSGRGCKDKIFVLKQLLEKYRKKRKKLHVAFMDLKRLMIKYIYLFISKIIY